MSVLVTFNGANYIIPETNEVGWGSNLTDYLVALAAGSLQKTGGSFLLSAEVDFGASFGLQSLYYRSRSANVATTGVFRFANNSDAIAWRNFANSADLPLLVNTANQLTFNGTPIGGAGIFTANRAIVSDGSGDLTASATTSTEIGYLSGVTSALQTQINAKKSIATGNAFKWETTDASGNLQETTVTASRAVATDANGLPVASATTAAELGFVSGVTSAIQTQINTKAPSASPTFTGTITTPLTANRALVTGPASELAVSVTTAAELAFVSGVTSAIQTQLDGKLTAAGGTLTGDLTFASGKGIFWTDSGTNTVKITAPTTITSTYVLKWPTAQGASNQYLTNDGLGNLSWTNAAGTGTVNTGTQYQLAYYATSTNTVSGHPTIITSATGDFTVDSPTFFVDATNNIIGIGTISPSSYNSAARNIVISSAAATAGLTIQQAANGTGFLGFADAVGTVLPGLIQYSHNATAANEFFSFRVASVDDVLHITPTSIQVLNGTASLPSYSFINDSDTGIYLKGGDSLGYTVGGTVWWSMNGTGDITAEQATGGHIYGGSGTAALPTFSFSTDPDTGIYNGAANRLNIALGGVNKLTFDSAGFLNILSSDVYIAPTQRLYLDGGGNTYIVESSADVLDIVVGNTTSLRSTAGQTLHVSGTAALPSISFIADPDTGMYSAGANILGFSTGGASRWTISADGSLLSALSGGTAVVRIPDGTSTAPSLSFTGETGTGFYRAGSQNPVIVAGNVKLVDAKTTGVAILGTTTNDNATTGYVGESVRSVASDTAYPSTGTYGDLTSISLTAGDWLVTGMSTLSTVGTTTQITVGISTTSGNSQTGLSFGDNQTRLTVSTGGTGLGQSSIDVPAYRMSLSATTTVYLKFSAVFVAGGPTAVGRLSAVRIR